MPDYPLGRIAVADTRDRAFPMAIALGPVVMPKSKTWRIVPSVLNQGQLGACVGFTGADWLAAEPIRDKVTNQTGLDLYWAAKAIDGLPPGTEGTYDRALCKVLQAQGRIESYLWAQTPEEIRQWVLTKGTVMVGTNWYGDMFDPTPDGFVHIGGGVVGGHEYLIRGYRHGWDAYKFRNHWGPNWGLKGEGWIKRIDLNRLVFDEGGDACAAIESRPPK